jgi:hypothetical protein
MLKVIGWFVVFYALFYFGIAQAILLWTVALGTAIVGI